MWLASLAALLLVTTAVAQAPPPRGNAGVVKADFLPKFPRYVEWPATARPGEGQPFQLCVVGTDPFGPRLDQAAASEQVDGRPVAIRRLPDAAEAGTCHVAFVHGTTVEDTTRLLGAFADRPVLTVTDGDGMPHGMIHFTTRRGRVGFLIDDAAAAARGLTISSRLLALAMGVRQRRS
ncbi:YfiR family protein [Sphingosinicella sp. LHD-64]|uniref:YfiR family protein n=1 Tax=Sphingosinicella sp. LHD-64 TaxID=3072139 RepID=UPI00280F6539|nr:YfiR family protein [Sphingosinicella sp. LHD-64]MDQ8757765.1 YfiR family protein [Sphingosinicella sp. LHD-64]